MNLLAFHFVFCLYCVRDLTSLPTSLLSFGTVLCLLYPAHLRAAAALFLALLQLGIRPQPQTSANQRRSSGGTEGLGKSWYELFHNDIREDDLKGKGTRPHAWIDSSSNVTCII